MSRRAEDVRARRCPPHRAVGVQRDRVVGPLVQNNVKKAQIRVRRLIEEVTDVDGDAGALRSCHLSRQLYRCLRVVRAHKIGESLFRQCRQQSPVAAADLDDA